MMVARYYDVTKNVRFNFLENLFCNRIYDLVSRRFFSRFALMPLFIIQWIPATTIKQQHQHFTAFNTKVNALILRAGVISIENTIQIHIQLYLERAL